ncbi:hypothetical protein D3C71_1055130 [compost metagenome]
MNVEDLSQRVRHKAGGSDSSDKQIEVRQRLKALPASHIEQGGDDVRYEQRRQHHRKDNASGQRRAKNTNGQIGGEEDKREAECAPGGVETKNRDRQLHQIVTGSDHQ